MVQMKCQWDLRDAKTYANDQRDQLLESETLAKVTNSEQAKLDSALLGDTPDCQYTSLKAPSHAPTPDMVRIFTRRLTRSGQRRRRPWRQR